jgi:hypothetical protein
VIVGEQQNSVMMVVLGKFGFINCQKVHKIYKKVFAFLLFQNSLLF